MSRSAGARPNACHRRIEAGRLRVAVRETYPLAEAAEAHRAIEAKRTTGKIVLVP